MTELYFMVRHTPFWAIPLLIVSAEFGYVFWLKRKRHKVKVCGVFALLAIVALVWYYQAGGPEKAVRKLIKLQRSYEL
jgi:hypothetical protein